MNEKLKCILAYIFSWLGGLVVLFAFTDNDRNTNFHAAQSVVVGVGYCIINAAYTFTPIYIPFFSTALLTLYIICVVIGIIRACNESNPELPLIGNVTKAIFGSKVS